MKYSINGYWKDNINDEFYNFIVSSDKKGDDENMFYYGLDETEILKIIELGFNSNYDFIITSYFEII